MTNQPVCQFSDRLTSALEVETARADSHSHDHPTDAASTLHTHGLAGDGMWTPDEHGHTHEHLEHAGGSGFSPALSGRS